MGLVGPLTMRSLEKAEAKEEFLAVKNWIKKISYKAYYTGRTHQIKAEGKQITLIIDGDNAQSSVVQHFESVFFTSQVVVFNSMGFANKDYIVGRFRNNEFKIDLRDWVNGEEAHQ
ncbi:hypothetical protein GCM10017161_05190 [Thalassotalea marina]|uniref:Uncharacterized protein n=2 Tax=Thalassotalea marina TaxID=1673741 RepID=A0A919BBI4_9GAMM|nr:hypothetical protein GCM10017161_05190 [Thalassotalea marina]